MIYRRPVTLMSNYLADNKSVIVLCHILDRLGDNIEFYQKEENPSPRKFV